MVFHRNVQLAPDQMRCKKSTHRDAHGNISNDGDTVIIIKNLKCKGSSIVINSHTKPKKIDLTDESYDIDHKIFSNIMMLKSKQNLTI